MEHTGLFIGALVTVYLLPGPDMLLILQTAGTQGRRAALAVAAGLALARCIHVTLAGLGLAALLHNSPQTFEGLRLVGAAYLVWLGIQGLRDAWQPPTQEEGTAQGRNTFGAGALLSLSNPKNIVFWGALGSALAGIVEGTPSQAQMVVFFAGFMVASLLWCFICAALVDWLRRHTSLLWQRISYAGCGALLLMLAGLTLRGL